MWTVEKGSDFDKYLDGKSDNYDPVVDFLSLLSKIRDPLKTPLLEELEREYGISKNENLTEAQRRAFLREFAFSSDEKGTREVLEEKLNNSGFSVQVYANDPAVDPQVVLDQAFKMVAGGANAYAGRVDAFARRQGGELIVNGDKFKEVPKYLSIADGQFSYAGNNSMFAGSFNTLESVKIEYPVPTNPADWPFIVFIGGDATFNMDGKITYIEPILQPQELRNEYLDIILKYKPLHVWIVSVVDFV